MEDNKVKYGFDRQGRPGFAAFSIASDFDGLPFLAGIRQDSTGI
jgi:hypothetical protein